MLKRDSLPTPEYFGKAFYSYFLQNTQNTTSLNSSNRNFKSQKLGMISLVHYNGFEIIYLKLHNYSMFIWQFDKTHRQQKLLDLPINYCIFLSWNGVSLEIRHLIFFRKYFIQMCTLCSSVCLMGRTVLWLNSIIQSVEIIPLWQWMGRIFIHDLGSHFHFSCKGQKI